MAKQRFKIPTSLDMSYLDLEFNFRTKDGLSFNKPLTAKSVIMYLMSGMLLLYILLNTFVKSSIPLAVLFAIIWILLTILLVKMDNTKRTGLELMVPLLGYFSPNNRYLTVRSLDPIGPLKGLYGISDVDKEDGLLLFTDGTVGYLYHVVGSASILMFDEDKKQIIDKVDSFYRKLAPDTELIFDTIKESQKTDEQVANLVDNFKKLKINSPGLKHLYHEQYDILSVGVGGRFKSLHQYMIVKANTMDHLEEFENLLYGDVENEQLMFKSAMPLSYDETTEYFKGLFGKD